MKVVTLKDWGRHKEGTELEITDKAVLAVGMEKGVIAEAKEPKAKEAKK